MPVRIDYGPLARPEKLKSGFVRAQAHITRAGIFTYRNPDGTTRKELRLPDEVFDSGSLKSFSMAPVTDDHPPEMLTADNVKHYQKGHLGEIVKKDDDHAVASMMITDPELIRKMEKGKVQVSCGYHCDVDELPGEWRGEKYDAIQRNIRGNHVAVVDVGRAGETCAVRMDAGDAVMVKKKDDGTYMGTGSGTLIAPKTDIESPEVAAATVEDPEREEDPGIEASGSGNDEAKKPVVEPVTAAAAAPNGAGIQAAGGNTAINKMQTPATVVNPSGSTGGLEASKRKDSKMDKVTIDGVAYEMAPEAARAVVKLQGRLDAAEKARLDAADPATVAGIVSARVALLRQAEPFLGDARTDAMSDRDVKIAVLKKLGVEISADASDGYLEGRYDAELGYASKQTGLSEFRRDAVHASSEQRVDANERAREHKKKMHGVAPLPADAVTKGSK
jgi:hypothetical protein